jgi:hypothetical protein
MITVLLHERLRLFVDEILTDLPGGEPVSLYFVNRAQYEHALRQDLLPFLVRQALSRKAERGDFPAWSEAFMPLLACWALYLAGCHFLDDAQDNNRLEQVNRAVIALSAAQIALSQLTTTEEALRDIMEALGRVTAIAAQAQNREGTMRQKWTREEYFQIIGGKSAAVIAVGCWLGGRMAGADNATLTMLKQFGLALGMAMQVSDDCLDLGEDLANGIYTLPVIEGLALREHPEYPLLSQLLAQPQPSRESVAQIVFLLESMGAIAACQPIIRAYQAQAAAVFDRLPALEPYFAHYVAASS